MFLVAIIVKDRTILKTDIIKGVNGDKLDIVLRFLATESKKVLNEPGSGDNRRTAIKGKAILFIDISTSTRFITLLKQNDMMPLCLQTNGG